MSGYGITPVQQDVFAVVQPWLAAVTGLDLAAVIQGLGNRSAVPLASPGFVAMTAVMFSNLRTPVETWDTTNPDPTALASESGTKLAIQLDFYSGPGASPNAADWAKAVSGVWRTAATCLAFEPACDPLYADEGQMAPLDDSEDQYEVRWTLTAYVQYNPVTTVPMQFADQAEVTLISVDEKYPP